jgi:hypothetical protein
VDRGQELIGASPKNGKLLRQIYDLRSCVEHVKDFRRELRKPRGVARDQAFAFWSLCAELLAGEVYKKILVSSDLRDRFQSEQRSQGFWKKRADRRARLLDPHIDIWAAVAQGFRRSQPEDWL